MSITIKLFAVAGLAFVLIILPGIFLDVKDIDKTKGGYEPPYIGVSGKPVDWDSMDLISTGLVKRGGVSNMLVNGTTGMSCALPAYLYAREILASTGSLRT